MADRLFHYTTADFARECVADLDAGRPWLMDASPGSPTPIDGMIVAVGVWEDGEWRVDELE